MALSVSPSRQANIMGNNIQGNKESLLVHAVGSRDATAVTKALLHGEDPHTTCSWFVNNNVTVLCYAADHEDIDAVKAILESEKVDVDHRKNCVDWTPLCYIAAKGNIAIAQLLLARGANPNLTMGIISTTPFLTAVTKGNCSMVDFLLENGADINLAPSEGILREPPLVKAAMVGNQAMCHLLLQRGAKPDIQDNWGNNSIYYAARNGNGDMIKLIIKNGGDQEWGLKAAAKVAREKNHDNLANWLDEQSSKDHIDLDNWVDEQTSNNPVSLTKPQIKRTLSEEKQKDWTKPQGGKEELFNAVLFSVLVLFLLYWCYYNVYFLFGGFLLFLCYCNNYVLLPMFLIYVCYYHMQETIAMLH